VSAATEAIVGLGGRCLPPRVGPLLSFRQERVATHRLCGRAGRQVCAHELRARTVRVHPLTGSARRRPSDIHVLTLICSDDIGGNDVAFDDLSNQGLPVKMRGGELRQVSRAEANRRTLQGGG
jgi:hypothetical protein